MPGETAQFNFHAPDGAHVQVKSPLVSVATVQSILFSDAKQIIEFIEDGTFQFAFDIRARSARQLCLRVSTQSLVDYIQKKKRDCHLDDGKLLQSFLPTTKPCVSAIVIARTLSCDTDHVHKLIREKCLTEFTRRSRTQTAQIAPANFFQFLNERRYP